MRQWRFDEVELSGEIRRTTEMAVLFFDGQAEVWLPRRLIVEMDTKLDAEHIGRVIPPEAADIVITERIAVEKGLI